MADRTLQWAILPALLLLTILLGTFRSFSVYSVDNAQVPIHQLTRIPAVVSTTQATTATTKLAARLPYFATKTNFLNQKLVKLGWAWTTLVIWLHALAIASSFFPSSPSTQSPKRDHPPPAAQDPSHPSRHVPRILSLHLVATLLWILFTQWCFGSSIFERLLILTGAKCMPSLSPLHSTATGSPLDQHPTDLENVYCQQRWGRRLPDLDQFIIAAYKPYWAEGIDVSGHTFLLSFSILLIVSCLHSSIHLLWKTKRPELIPRNYRWAVYINLALLAIWWWMILMTSLYFHGPVEKLSGFALGTAAWFLTEVVVDRLLA
ncbi:hypothetical protein PCASD_25594 [Puccinia coronata f. sp. avenae]|uniref:Uncharacterized protein n=1 Tax=Puccinia coronata f. sp. avenae TaxID=200324 RepID=A0A2N5S051_9BASI|nr:hypothetical protein PCASD_25594 [Puccinia coronata f. sp. avenae]